MANTPNSGTVYNNAAAMHFDSRTPGMNVVISAWGALQDFTGNWAVRNYSSLVNLSSLIGEFAV